MLIKCSYRTKTIKKKLFHTIRLCKNFSCLKVEGEKVKDILTKGANDRKAMRPLIDLKPSGNTFISSSEGNQTVKSDDVKIYQYSNFERKNS